MIIKCMHKWHKTNNNRRILLLLFGPQNEAIYYHTESNKVALWARLSLMTAWPTILATKAWEQGVYIFCYSITVHASFVDFSTFEELSLLYKKYMIN